MWRGAVSLVSLILFVPVEAALLESIQRDYRALIARSSTRHIMQPRSPQGREQCLRLKSELRLAQQSGQFVVDAFADAAREHSTDTDTADRGGMFGELLPQGAVRSRVMDRLCFTAPLGQIIGPVESEFGWHLLLVEERRHCPKLDGGMTRVVAEVDPTTGNAISSLRPPSEPRNLSERLQAAPVVSAMSLTLATFLGAQLLGQIIASMATAIAP